MALIACPECKGKVSDTAKTCPHCGFDLTNNTKQNNINKEILNIPFPKNPFLTKIGIFEILITILSLVISILLVYMLIAKFHVSIFISILAGIILISIIQIPFIGKFTELLKEYKLAKTDFSTYQKQKYNKLKEESAESFLDTFVGLSIVIGITAFILYIILRLLVKMFFW